jgi:hypothetical protein
VDKPRRGNAPIIMAAPRGKGIDHLVSDLASMSVGDRHGGSGRGTPWSNTLLPKTKPSGMDDKRGTSKTANMMLLNPSFISLKDAAVIRSASSPITFEFYRNHRGNCFNTTSVIDRFLFRASHSMSLFRFQPGGNGRAAQNAPRNGQLPYVCLATYE